MDLWNFMLDGLKKRSDIHLVPYEDNFSFFNRLCRKVLRNHAFCFSEYLVLNNCFRKKLDKLKLGDSIIVCDYADLCLFQAIKKCIPNGVKVHLWLWNPVCNDSKMIESIALLQKMNVQCHTFDVGDSNRYKMNLHTAFYNMKSSVSSMQTKFDFYFLGADKGRAQKIKMINDILKQFTVKIVIPRCPAEYLTYTENVENILQSKCVIDVPQVNQTGLTLRPLEALAFKRKLLTTNKAVKQLPFYNSNNIFILGEDAICGLNDFLSKPYFPINDKILHKYDVNTWVDSIM